MNDVLRNSCRLNITATHQWVGKINTFPAVRSGAAEKKQGNKNNYTDNDTRTAPVTRDDQRARGMFTFILQRKRSLTLPVEALLRYTNRT